MQENGRRCDNTIGVTCYVEEDKNELMDAVHKYAAWTRRSDMCRALNDMWEGEQRSKRKIRSLPQALQRIFPAGSRRHRGLSVVWQFVHGPRAGVSVEVEVEVGGACSS